MSLARKLSSVTKASGERELCCFDSLPIDALQLLPKLRCKKSTSANAWTREICDIAPACKKQLPSDSDGNDIDNISLSRQYLSRAPTNTAKATEITTKIVVLYEFVNIYRVTIAKIFQNIYCEGRSAKFCQ